MTNVDAIVSVLLAVHVRRVAAETIINQRNGRYQVLALHYVVISTFNPKLRNFPTEIIGSRLASSA